MAHLDEYKLLSDRQHEFRKGHSCETQLTTVINDVAKILDNRGQADTFILDFEKAFDTHPHELLKSKLFSYGIGGKTLKWIDSFHCFRQQRVVVNGVKSDWAPVKGLKGKASVSTDDLIPKIRHCRNPHFMAFQTPIANTDVYKGSFFPQSIRNWNALPDSLISSAEDAEDCVAKFTSLVRARS